MLISSTYALIIMDLMFDWGCSFRSWSVVYRVVYSLHESVIPTTENIVSVAQRENYQ